MVVLVVTASVPLDIPPFHPAPPPTPNPYPPPTQHHVGISGPRQLLFREKSALTETITSKERTN